jgi:histidinol-phosphate aminotransferase
MNDRSSNIQAAANHVAAVVRPEILSLKAYVVAHAKGLVKLDANENPFALPEAMRDALGKALGDIALNRYPEGVAEDVIAALRSLLRLPDTLGVLLGNGSDELIQIITLALARPGAAVLVPEPTFVMYRMSALYAGMRFVGVPLRGDLTLDIDAMLAAILRERPALVFLASPNNPTGNAFADVDIERIVRAAPGLVVLDEAYGDFAGRSFLPRLPGLPNLLILRTLSKVGMAALRLGYAIASPAWIGELNKVRPPYNINALTQAAALTLLAEPAWLAAQTATIVAERERLVSRLSSIHDVLVFQTHANFVTMRVSNASEWFGRLREAGILVKNLHGSHPLLAECLRITVGTPSENDALIAALQTIVSSVAGAP